MHGTLCVNTRLLLFFLLLAGVPLWLVLAATLRLW